MVPFLVFALITTFAAGNEGGFECVKQEGLKPCVERMVENRDPVDYKSLNQ